jgi:hypothetical protein
VRKEYNGGGGGACAGVTLMIAIAIALDEHSVDTQVSFTTARQHPKTNSAPLHREGQRVFFLFAPRSLFIANQHQLARLDSETSR